MHRLTETHLMRLQDLHDSAYIMDVLLIVCQSKLYFYFEVLLISSLAVCIVQIISVDCLAVVKFVKASYSSPFMLLCSCASTGFVVLKFLNLLPNSFMLTFPL